MGLTGNTTNALLALNGLDSSPNSAVSVEDTEAGPAESGQKVCGPDPVGISGPLQLRRGEQRRRWPYALAWPD
jgi:hypothetical protein